MTYQSATLSNTQEDSSDDKTSKVLDKGSTDTDETKHDDEKSHRDRTKTLEGEIRRHLEEDELHRVRDQYEECD